MRKVHISPDQMGVRHTKIAGQMDKLEEQFSKELDRWVGVKILKWYRFDCMKFRLAWKTFYSPDFIAVDDKGRLIAYEVKGHWEDDARVKIKTAAQLFPWVLFIAVQKKKGRWHYEEIPRTEPARGGAPA